MSGAAPPNYLFTHLNSPSALTSTAQAEYRARKAFPSRDFSGARLPRPSDNEGGLIRETGAAEWHKPRPGYNARLDNRARVVSPCVALLRRRRGGPFG